jgi:hypothetical protein
MPNENIPSPPSPERPPYAPYDPPEPAPQAMAWRRAMVVVGCLPAVNAVHMVRTTHRRVTRHRA